MPICKTRSSKPSRMQRRGSVLIYSFFMMTVMFSFISFGVDFAHVQTVKTELQSDADATARGAMQMYLSYGQSISTAEVPVLAANACNPVDANSGTAATVAPPVWGNWAPSSKTFTAGGSPMNAVKIVISRTTATGNPVKLTFPLMNGLTPVRTTCDVWAQAIAYLAGGQSGSVSIPATASLYLAGMPAGSTTVGYGDSTSNAAPSQMVSVPVVPGTYVSFTSLSGTSTIVPGYVTPTGAAGSTSIFLHHGENYDHNPDPGYVNPENGIGDATMPADAFCGVFLTNNAPTAASPPAAVDWTSAAQSNQSTYTNLVNQQPFMIGSGKTTGGVTKQFLVPAGATRMYLSIWDGVCYSNNSGTINGTISVKQQIQMVK